ncbi:MAG: hypothetical protein L6R41_001093 [Letrouitia leprolyta]|nr:MAG: hypothetical protein L6R41_001093 [Letrouitia leprolyta]
MSTTTSTLPTTRAFLSSLFASFPTNSLPSSSPPSETTSNPLTTAPPSIKPLLLTLHVLFPNELLPALDLLDRKLVIRFTLESSNTSGIASTSTAAVATTAKGGKVGVDNNEDVPASAVVCRRNVDEGGMTNSAKEVPRTVYYVRSSQQQHGRSRFSHSATGRTYDAFASSVDKSYEVRLKAWNCSCPAFAFASLGCMGVEGLSLGDDDEVMVEEGGEESRDGRESEGARKERRFGGLIRGEGEMPVCKHLLACLLAESWEGFGRFVEERVMGRDEMGGWAAGWGG